MTDQLVDLLTGQPGQLLRGVGGERQAELAAFRLQPGNQHIFEQGIEHDSGRFLEVGQRPVELLLGPHQGVHMLDRQHLGVLRRRRPGDGDQSLTGRIRDHVEVKIARCVRHR